MRSFELRNQGAELLNFEKFVRYELIDTLNHTSNLFSIELMNRQSLDFKIYNHAILTLSMSD